uniref:FA complementation group B n=1 Tax=Scophthalmus maximus TaxID=52904 RepID=A0A8D3B580_SCOMX
MEGSHSEELYRNPHLLSLSGKIIVFNHTPASCAKDGDRGESISHGHASFERASCRFLKAAPRAVAIGGMKTSAHVDIRCKCAVDVQRRVTTPCVLVTRRSEKGASFRYSLLTLSRSNRLEPCFEFTLPYEMKGSVLRGPTVLWSHAGHVFYTSLQAGEVRQRQIPLPLSHCVFGELPLHRGQVFVLGLHNECEDQTTSRVLGYMVESGQAFDGSVVLPLPYVGITRCMLVLSADKEDGALKVAAVAATSHQQLVYFQNGNVKDTCPLPFQLPEDIQLANTGRNGFLFVISFHQGHVCAVWKETFQIASCWSGVSSVHVDDFLGCGTDQILLFFRDGGVKGLPLDHFLITDLCGISYSVREKFQTSPLPENNLLTLQALESRLQSGLTVLQELQREVRVKDRVVQQSVQALNDVSSGRELVLTPPEQEGLSALWDSDDESNDEASDDKTQDMPAVSSNPQIDKLWHRIAEDRIVVGVILMIDSSVVSLSILTETGQSSTPAVIQTQSQVLWLPTPCPSSSSSASTLPEPAAKRCRQRIASTPNDLNTCRMAVTAVSRLTPLLNSGCVKCRVMLHYVQRQDAFSLLSSPTPVVLHCGQVAVDIRSDFQTQLLKNPKLKTDEVKEDLLCLLTVLDRWVFHIDSPDHSLGDIDGWIQKIVGCKRVDVSPQYLLFDSAGPSALILLGWRQITPFQGELSVHSSQLQMLKFLDSLLAYLPVSCSVQPVKGTRGPGAAHAFSLALEKEAVSLGECVSLLLSEKEEDEKRRNTGHDETGSVEGLQRCREAWQRDVERSRMRLSPLVDVGRYRKLTQSVFRVQLDGDLAWGEHLHPRARNSLCYE